MKRAILFFTVIFALGSVYAQQERGFKRVRLNAKDHIALVVGNTNYPDMPLKNPVNDANAVAAAFENMGFIVEKVLDADREGMAQAIDRFSAKLKTARVAVFYFAGHGMQVDGQNYLIPIGRTPDQQISKVAQVPYRAINAGELLAIMETHKVKFSLIVLDACRNNPIGGKRGKLKGLASIDAPAGSLVMYATKAGDVADDGNSKNSPFTTAFLKHIQTPGLDVNLLPLRVTNTVLELTNGEQTPGAYTQLRQSFTFVPLLTAAELEAIRKRQKANLTKLQFEEAEMQRQREREEAELANQQAAIQRQKQRDEAELQKKQAEIAALDKQIANLKNEMGTSGGDLDQMLKVVEQREAQAAQLKAMREKAEAERKRQEAELEAKRKKAEAERKKREQKIKQMKEKKLSEQLAKYQKIANSQYGQDMKLPAWNSILKKQGLEQGSIEVGNTAALYKKLGLTAPPPPAGTAFTDAKTGMAMVWTGGGTFEMGGDGYTKHTVRINNFAMMKYEVTFAEYDKFCEATGRSKPSDSGWGRRNRPVINVTWHDAVAYAEWLSQKTGQTWRLPTEAEWEFAARGGSKSKGYKYAGSNNIDEVAEYYGNNNKKTKPVGGKKPNELGLYDMSGNVWEWCSDWYDSNYYSKSPTDNPIGALSGSHRVLRGGSWFSDAEGCRSADRGGGTPANRRDDYGFRLVRLF